MMYYTTVTCQLSIHGNELCIVFSVNDVLCYSAWQGPFYPLNLENSKWLSYYSQVFDFVEIDSDCRGHRLERPDGLGRATSSRRASAAWRFSMSRPSRTATPMPAAAAASWTSMIRRAPAISSAEGPKAALRRGDLLRVDQRLPSKSVSAPGDTPPIKPSSSSRSRSTPSSATRPCPEPRAPRGRGSSAAAGREWAALRALSPGPRCP